MKTNPTSHWITALLLAAPLAAAQEPVKLAETPYEVIERGPHHRTWQREIQWQEPDGRLTTETNSYVETHTGMHYWEDKQWKESREVIEVFEQGAVARYGRTKVIFSPAIDDPEGSVIIETPDGQTLRTGILALNYKDPVTGEQITLGIVKESYAQLVPPNRIIYPDALDGVKADIIYTYTKRGVTQDVLLLEKPPAPELLGLSAESRLEIMTEIFEAPEPEKRVSVLRREEDPVKRARMAEPDLTDEELWFGEMVIGLGRAFWQNAEPGDTPELGEWVDVAKRWYEAPDGRRVLIESAPHQELEPLMRELPEFGEEEARVLPEKRDGMEAGTYVPDRELAQVRENKPVLMARAGTYPRRGLNLDYTTLDTSYTNHTFKGDTTYYVTDPVDLYGTTILEGGTVIKFDKLDLGTGYQPRIYVRGPFVCKTDPYSPAILTAKDDNTVGEFVSGGTLEGDYAYSALYMYNTGNPIVLENVQIKHARHGALFWKNTSNLLRNAQIVDCRYGVFVAAASVQVQNLLIDGIVTYGLYATGTGATIQGEHLTLHDVNHLRFLDTGTSLSLTNSLFVDVSNLGSFTGSHNFTNSSYSATFESVGAGNFYLPSASPYRDAGTTNIHPDLLRDLRKRTTRPPVLLTNSISSATTLGPIVERDTDAPDIGFHYLPIDYAVGNLEVSATLTLTDGVVVAGITNKAIILKSGAKVVSAGSASAPNRLIRHASVQEQIDLWDIGGSNWRWFFAAAATNPELHFRFTELPWLAGPHLHRNLLSGSISRIAMQDSRMDNVVFSGSPAMWVPTRVGLTNNLFLRSSLKFSEYYSEFDVHLRNNLLVEGSLILEQSQSPPGYFNWTVKDNVFDNSTVTNNGYYVANSHNGYINTGQGLSGGSANVVVSTFDYGEGPLGRFYQVSTNFTDQGSQLASAAGLYHYTTRLSQIKDGNSTNDLGFHYVSTDPKDGLVGHWKLDEGTGTTAMDSSGYENHGTLVNGPVWRQGALGSALDFNDMDQFVTVPDSPELTFATGDFTMAAWVSTFSNGTLLSKGGGGSPATTEYIIQANSAGFDFRSEWFNSPALWVPKDGSWNHVAVVFTDADDTLRFYENGVYINSSVASGNYATDTTRAFYLGTQGEGGYNDHDGGLDDVRVFNRALDSTEVAALASTALWDSDGDGLPDYLEDANGNGVVDSGESPFDDAGNGAITFTGATNSYAIRSGFNGFPSDEITVEFWMRSTNTTLNGTPIGYAISGADNHFLVYNYRNFSIYKSGIYTSNSGVSANDGDWHHIAATWRSADGRMELYKDGVLVFSELTTATTPLTPGGTIVLGQEQDSPGGGFDDTQSFQGDMDEVRIWNHVRSGTEISANRYKRIDGGSWGLVGYWRMDEEQGTTLNDASGYGNHLTLVGTSWTTSPLTDDTDIDGFPDEWEQYWFSSLATNLYTDLDGDGLLSYEEYHLGTSPIYADSDYDGRSDAEELAEGKDPLSFDDFLPVRLAYVKFDDPSWITEEGRLPRTNQAVQSVSSWSGNAMHISGDFTEKKFLKYHDVEPVGGSANLNVRKGTIQFWFRPSWTSTNLGGAGPGEWPRMFDVGAYSSTPVGWWSLRLDPYGNSVAFGSHTNGASAGIILQSTVSWTEGQWYHVSLTYSPTSSKLYFNGEQVASGGGVTVYPGPDMRALHGFNIGSNRVGSEKADGDYEELETFNYMLSAQDVALRYRQFQPVIQLSATVVDYYVGDPATLLDPGASLDGPPALPVSELSLDIVSNAHSSDILSIRNEGTGPGEVGVSGADVSYGGTVVGSFTGGQGTTPLVVAFNTNATLTASQAILRNVTFYNNDQAASLWPRSVEVVLTNSEDLESTPAVKVVNVFNTADWLSAESTWKYLDDGSDQGTNWSQPTFNDSTWSSDSAELGYGDGDEATVVSYGPSSSDKHITTYFRKVINLSNPTQVGNVLLGLKRDDGAVVYVNGVEAARSNMPEGAIDSETLAASVVDGSDEDAFNPIAVPSSLFVDGTNVIGVEIHQISPTSSDISFDLEVIGNPLPPTVQFLTPTNGSTFVASDDITMTASASDDIGVKKVVFYRNGIRIGETSQESGGVYSFTWTNAVAGVHTLNARAVDVAGWSTVSSEEVIITVQSHALFIGNSPLNSSDQAATNRLGQLGFVVTAMDESAATAADAEGKTIVVISSSPPSSGIGSTFRDTVTPVLTWEDGVYDEMEMTDDGSSEKDTISGQTQVDIIETNHLMAAELNGTVTVVSTQRDFAWGKPGTNATVIATVAGDSTRAVIFGYEQGDLMKGLAAPGRRVGFFMTTDVADYLTTDGWSLFDAAVSWAVEYPCFPAVDAITVLDRSTSMRGDPLVHARQAASDFMASLQMQSDMGGVVTFGNASTLVHGLSQSAGSLLAAIDGITVNTQQGSRIDLGIAEAHAELLSTNANPDATPLIVLLSDGNPSVSDQQVLDAANAAKEAGIRIITVGFGDVDEVMLSDLATSPSDFWYAPDSAELSDIFTSIAALLCRPGDVPPSVTLTDPEDSTLYLISPTNIVLQATATPGDGIIERVEFYANEVKLGEDPASPYQHVWTNATAGTYQLAARAIDNDGLDGWSATNTITINALPTVAIVDPADDSSSGVGTNIVMKAEVIDPEGNLNTSMVRFFEGTMTNTLIGTATGIGSDLYQLTWNDPPLGIHAITARAEDQLGAERVSELIIVTVTNDNAFPTIEITYPTNGASFRAGVDLTITATASDPGGSITNVEFFVDGVLLGNDPTSPYSITRYCWAPGSYVLTAKATDNGGAKTMSDPVSITVTEELPMAGEGFWDPVFGNPGVGFQPTISALVNDGTNLYAGGEFRYFHDIGANAVAKWNGTAWAGLGEGLGDEFDSKVRALALDGSVLYAGGDFTKSASNNITLPYIAKWDGTNWSSVGNDLNDQVRAIKIIGSTLYVGGDFTQAGTNTLVKYIARLNSSGTAWEPVGNGLTNAVYAIESINNVLYIGGEFTNAGGNTNADHIARLDGTTWANLGSGMSGTNTFGGTVRALAVCGTELFAGGDFNNAGGDTNANCIATWDGKQWKAIGKGVLQGDATADSYSLVAPSILTITLRGKQVFVGGEFTEVSNGTNILNAEYVARATWNEQTQDWTWSDLDRGLFGHVDGEFDFNHVLSSTVISDPTGNAYDLFFGGCFLESGAAVMTNQNLARWSVGRPYPSAAPVVVLTAPAEGAMFSTSDSITNLASVVQGATNFTEVTFLIDGNPVGVSDPIASGSHTNVWSSPAAGVHILTAVARDTNSTLKTISRPVVFTVKGATQLATNDLYTLFVNDPGVDFLVLTNDAPGVRLSSVFQVQNDYGKVEVSHDGTYVHYTPFPNIYGTDIFTYSVTNSVGTSDSASVTVKLRAKPEVHITSLYEGLRTATPANLQVEGTAFDWDGAVTNVQLFVNGSYHSQTTPTSGDTFSFSWSQSTPGFYTFEAVGKDTHGLTNAPIPVTIAVYDTGGSPPIASIENLQNEATTFTTLETFDYPVIRDAFLDLEGEASDPDGDPVTYRLALYHPDNIAQPVADLTPGPLNARGYHIGAATNVLASLNLVSVPNGIYDLVLFVTGGGDEVQTSVRVSIQHQVQIGRLTFSEQDLVIPVNGIPLTVVRTYDSFNEVEGTFGFNWSLSLNDMEVEIDEQREVLPVIETLDYSDSSPVNLSVRTGGGRNVTLTLPDGRRTTFVFTPRRGDLEMYAEWAGPPGVHAELTMAQNNVIDFFCNGWGVPCWRAGELGTDYEFFDINEYILTTRDGTAYHITREAPESGEATYYVEYSPEEIMPVKPYPGKPKLNRIVQRTGDEIFITDEGVTHKRPGGDPTRTVLFERDARDRIVAIRDPISGTNGLPVVKYIYNRDTGNLIQVHKLVDRSTGAYLTNKYQYNHPQFPHFVTDIKDARGISVARNLYDADGRLIGMIDASGQTNRFEHDITNRIETVFDRSGVPTTFAYDSRGNVTNSVNALGHTNSFTHDDIGSPLTQTDPLGNTTFYTNDAFGDVLSMTLPYPQGADPAAYTTHYTYNEFGDQTSVRLSSGAVVTNEFDASTGLLLAVKDGDGNLISSTTYDGLGQPITEGDTFGTNSFGYDALGDLIRFTNSLSGVITNQYDANGNLTVLSDSSGTSTMDYDAQGREMAADYGNGITVSNRYDSQLDWNSIDAPTIGHMERRFDEQGRLGGWTTANGSTPGFAYDVNGRLQYETNSVGVVTHSTYDQIGRLAAVTNLATEAGTTYGYDAASRRIAETNAYEQVTRYDYWPSGSLKTMTNATGTNVWLYSDAAGACDGCGTAITNTVTDPLDRVTEQVNSPHGLPLQFIRRASAGATGANAATNTTTYLSGLTTPEQEAEDYPVAITDEGGRTRQYGYTDEGQLFRGTDLSGATWWTNQFDADTGALTNILSPTGEKLAYTYDALDNVETIQFGDGEFLTNYFNAENRLNGTRLASGVFTTNLYDFAGRLTNRSSTIAETAEFVYNGNDVVTTMTDNTGSTTNLHDSAGRLSGIRYPTGARVDYGYDLLDRIVAVTNRATAGGTAYVTRYEYDSVGSITNVVDPFSGSTKFEYNRVGLRSKRTLPNGAVTTWEYNWKDQVTNITHKTSGGTTLASAAYERAPGGEPTKITREDSTYAILQYDSALRLTNEVYYSSGGVAQTTNSYSYDASGSRIKLVKDSTTLTNSVSAGYRITQVRNASNGSVVETYGYDNGGRVNTFTRDGATRNLGYNSADQVTGVTNTTASTWVTYGHDAGGRRTISTNSAGMVRRFVVAPTAESDLESPVLIANSGGTVQQGYVYLGHEPLMRHGTTSGSRVYYLEDGMGSVIGIAPNSSPSTSNTTRLFYDGFGNTTATNGPTPAIPTGTGGDFRFHGAWFETETGLYNMRAREYDSRMGRFTSRDLVEGDMQEPESFHPYVYANNNPYVYIDPSGLFSIGEIVSVQGIQRIVAGLKSVALNTARVWARQEIGGLFADHLMSVLEAYLPGLDRMKHIHGGRGFEGIIRDVLCETPFSDHLYFEVGVLVNGMPVDNGMSCLEANRHASGRRGVMRPDLIIGRTPPLGVDRQPNKTWLVAEIKLRTSTFHDYKTRPHKRRQFDATVKYAANHVIPKTAVFVSFTRGRRAEANAARTFIKKEAVAAGAYPVVVSFDPRELRRGKR